ncbi:MAG: hypothetical protein EOO90_08100 [Pedobacter sp.]|nr:MAG: hypothetical protein EOO90_08100 [Pedobacter sp.]
MKLSEHKELKAEILSLPLKEKDKLLLRLIAKDKVLTERLHFSLLEDEEDLRERVISIKREIEETKIDFATAREVLLNLRKGLKTINHFSKVTKSNFEEVDLRIFILSETTTDLKKRSYLSARNDENLFAVFFVKSILMTIRKFEKLHEDLQFDLLDDLNKLLEKAYAAKAIVNTAIELGLPKNI